MRFIVAGLDQDTGQPIELTLEAPDVASAATIASTRRIAVRAVRAGNSETPSTVGAHERVAMGSSLQKPRARLWLVAVMVFFPLLGFFAPTAALWGALVLIGLIVLYVFIGPLRSTIGAIFRVSPERPYWRAFKLMSVVAYCILLLAVGQVGFKLQGIHAAAAAQQAAQRAERDRRIDAANTRVTSSVAEARAALERGDVDSAQRHLEQAIAISDATNRGQAFRLQEQIEQASDSNWTLETLAMLDDADLQAFRDQGTVPHEFEMAVPKLTDRAVALAKTQFDLVAGRRAEIQQQQASAVEAQRLQALADEQAKRDAAEASKKPAKDRLDAFVAILEIAGVRLVEQVQVRRMGSETWIAEITVRDIWHLRHYQLRLQDAQSLWKAWATIASPKNPDAARIKLIDHQGNEVGGSRALAGSLIWVQEK